MSDREAFIATIAANPAEDTPRLVFADWLEEHGEAARAGFIRDQVRLAHVRPGTDEYKQLFARTAATLKANLPAWIQSACDAFGQEAKWKPEKRPGRWLTMFLGHGLNGDMLELCTFERGFITDVLLNINLTQKFEAVPTILCEHPITRLSVSRLSTATWPYIACDSLSRIRQLRLWDIASATVVTEVFSDPRWIAMRSLHLRGCDGEITDALCRTPLARQLEQLKLPLLPRILQALQAYPLDDRLQELVLKLSIRVPIGLPMESMIPHLNALPFRPTLKRLDLSVTYMQNAGLAAFARGELWLRLRSLVLDRNSIGDTGWRDFVRGRRTPELRKLSAAGNRIGNDGATRLGQSPLVEKLEYIDLRGNRIQGKGAIALARALAESPLKMLLLTGNPIDKNDAAMVRKILGSRVD